MTEVKLRVIEKGKTREKLTQIIDCKVTRELFFDLRTTQNVFLDRKRGEFSSFLEADRLIDRREVSQDVESAFRKFHRIHVLRFCR